MNKVFVNDKTSLFLDGLCLSFLGNMMRYGIWRIMWQGKRGRIIVYADLPSVDSDILSDGKTLELRYYERGRKDDPNGGIALYRFENIKLKRQWIPKPSPIEFDHELIVKFSEYECDIIELVTIKAPQVETQELLLG